MFKIVIIVFISLFSILNSAAVRRKKRESVENKETPKWVYEPRNYSDKLVDVLLRDPSQLNSKSTEYIPTNSFQKGLIELFLPGAPESLFLCFPQNAEDYRQAYILSHIICRQMGFMTFLSMNSQLSTSSEDKIFYGLKANSFSCTGQEQNVSHCEWNNVNIGSCKAITDLSCGDCQFASKDSSGFLEVPGYPLVNLHDVTCEWDLLLEDHSVSLSFHHFHSLFTKSSKLFCNLQEPYMDIMYGRWTKMNYQRYCNLEDIKNLTVPRGGVKIRLFTGVYAPHGVRTEAMGKGVAITFEAKPITEQASSWNWQITFVVLFILIFVITAAILHYCKKLGMCDVRRTNRNTLPTVNLPPTLAELDRAYEFQRCAIQGPLNEKVGLRMRSTGSGGKIKNIFFPSLADETFIISSADKNNVTQKENIRHHIYDETPRSVIPEIVLTGADESHPIERVKVNLLDRYSKNSCDVSGISGKVSSSSPMVFPSNQNFKIYSSVSSDTEVEVEVKGPPPPYESAL